MFQQTLLKSESDIRCQNRPVQIVTRFLCVCFPLFSGTYKPRIRCYDTYQLSLKFERCLDSDSKLVDAVTCYMSSMLCTKLMNFFSVFLKVVAFDILSDDYSKVRHLGTPCCNSLQTLLELLVFMYDLCCYTCTWLMTVLVKLKLVTFLENILRKFASAGG